MKPFFSIIIPTYNRATMIIKALESVVAQTYTEWELLIVDDGSTDNTREIVAKYTDERIKYIYQQNAERSAARNNGIKNARGTYICFLDSDDYYLPERLLLLHNFLQQHNLPVAFFYTGLVVDTEGTLKVRAEQPPHGNIFDYLAVAVIHSQQACVHSSILKQFTYDTNFSIGEDMELWLRIAEKHPIEYIGQQFTVAVVDHDSRSVNVKHYNSYPDRLRMLKRIFSTDHPGKNISTPLKRELIASCYFGTAKYYIYSNQRGKAVKYLLRAIFSDITNRQNKYWLNLIIYLVIRRASNQQMDSMLNYNL